MLLGLPLISVIRAIGFENKQGKNLPLTPVGILGTYGEQNVMVEISGYGSSLLFCLCKLFIQIMQIITKSFW